MGPEGLLEFEVVAVLVLNVGVVQTSGENDMEAMCGGGDHPALEEGS